MALVDIIRDVAIKVAHDVTISVQVDVLHSAWIGQSGTGVPRYATAVSRPCLFERAQRQIMTRDGREVMSRHKLSFIHAIEANGAPGREEPIDPRDKIEVPGVASGPIIDVEGLVDPGTGLPFYAIVWIGAKTQ